MSALSDDMSNRIVAYLLGVSEYTVRSDKKQVESENKKPAKIEQPSLGRPVRSVSSSPRTASSSPAGVSAVQKTPAATAGSIEPARAATENNDAKKTESPVKTASPVSVPEIKSKPDVHPVKMVEGFDGRNYRQYSDEERLRDSAEWLYFTDIGENGKKLSQYALAERYGIPQRTISDALKKARESDKWAYLFIAARRALIAGDDMVRAAIPVGLSSMGVEWLTSNEGWKNKKYHSDSLGTCGLHEEIIAADSFDEWSRDKKNPLRLIDGSETDQKEIALILDVSQARVSQLLSKWAERIKPAAKMPDPEFMKKLEEDSKKEYEKSEKRSLESAEAGQTFKEEYFDFDGTNGKDLFELLSDFFRESVGQIKDDKAAEFIPGFMPAFTHLSSHLSSVFSLMSQNPAFFAKLNKTDCEQLLSSIEELKNSVALLNGAAERKAESLAGETTKRRSAAAHKAAVERFIENHSDDFDADLFEEDEYYYTSWKPGEDEEDL